MSDYSVLILDNVFIFSVLCNNIIYHFNSIMSNLHKLTQMSIMSNVFNKRTLINTTRNTMAADLYAPKILLKISNSRDSENLNARR